MYLIGLGKQFHEKGMQEMDESIIPQLEGVFQQMLVHCVIPQYATLKWFCSKLCMHAYMHVYVHMYTCVYIWMYTWMSCSLQLVRNLHLEGYEEEVDAFFASQIADIVRKYQLESSEDVTPNAECDSTYIEHYAQKVLLWTAGRSQAEVPAKDKTVHVGNWKERDTSRPHHSSHVLKGCSSNQKEFPLLQRHRTEVSLGKGSNAYSPHHRGG